MFKFGVVCCSVDIDDGRMMFGGRVNWSRGVMRDIDVVCRSHCLECVECLLVILGTDWCCQA